MANAELPSTWADAAQSALGNSLWMLPLVAIERLVAGELGQAGILGVGWLVAIAVAVKLHVLQDIISSRERQRQLLTWALIICGAAVLGTGLYRLGAQQAPSGPQEITKTVLVRDPPTAEDIAKAAGDQMSSLTNERDSYKRQVDELRSLLPQAPPSTFVKSWQGFSVDEKARLRPIIGELSDIFDTKGAATVQLGSNLIQEVGDFQNPEDSNSKIYDPVVLNQRLKGAQLRNPDCAERNPGTKVGRDGRSRVSLCSTQATKKHSLTRNAGAGPRSTLPRHASHSPPAPRRPDSSGCGHRHRVLATTAFPSASRRSA
jgi:hypothetical protein